MATYLNDLVKENDKGFHVSISNFKKMIIINDCLLPRRLCLEVLRRDELLIWKWLGADTDPHSEGPSIPEGNF